MFLSPGNQSSSWVVVSLFIAWTFQNILPLTALSAVEAPDIWSLGIGWNGTGSMEDSQWLG